MSFKFKADNGKWITKRLFLENDYFDISHAVYTLKDEDHVYKGKTYLSLFRLYMECGDPTEYTFYNKHLGGRKHWEALCSTSWFSKHVEEWRMELHLKLQSEALSEILCIAGDKEHKGQMQAARFVLDKGWEPKNTKGRPSKKQITEEAQRIAEAQSELDEDFERVIN